MKYVINPGVNPELRYAADALSQLDDTKYFTTFIFGRNSLFGKIVRRLSPKSRAYKFLSRRLIDLEDKVIIRNGLIWEIAQVLTRARYPRLQKFFIKRRNHIIHKMVRKSAKRDLPDLALIHYTQSSESIKLLSALNCVTVLNYPIAHHGWMNLMLEKETSINPNLAKYLQVPEKDEDDFYELDLEISLSDYVLVGSSFVRDTFLNQGISDGKLIMINLGISQEEFKTELKNNYDYVETNRKLRLVFTGQINQRKGLSYLFEALKIYEEEVECLIMGLAPEPDFLNQIEIPKNVRLLGYKTKREMSDIYCQCDVFVFPSLAEGFPLSAIEAMAHGLSIILTRNTFAKDVVRNYSEGIVIDAHSTKDIVSAIKFYLVYPESIRKFGEAAQSKSLFFTWEKYQRELIESVRNIANE